MYRYAVKRAGSEIPAYWFLKKTGRHSPTQLSAKESVMKLEHWHSKQLGCWLLCNAETGDLLEHRPAKKGVDLSQPFGGWVCLEYPTEEDLLTIFPTSERSTKMGD